MYFPLQREHFMRILCSHRSPCLTHLHYSVVIAVHLIHIHDLFQFPYALLPFCLSPRLPRML